MIQVTTIVDSTGDLIFNDTYIIKKAAITAEKEATRVLLKDHTSQRLFECVPGSLSAPVVGSVAALFTWISDALDTGAGSTVTVDSVTNPVPVDDSTPIEVNHTAPIPVDDSTPIDVANTSDIKVDGSDVDDANPVPVKTPDGVTLSVALNTNTTTGDAFARLRISEALTLHDGKNIFGDEPNFWGTRSSGTGAPVYTGISGSVVLDVLADGDYVVRQSKQAFPYQAGKSSVYLWTGCLLGLKVDPIESKFVAVADWDVGSDYETIDSMGWKGDSATGDLSVYIENSVTGFIRETSKSSWNVDRLDGTGPSGFNIADANFRGNMIYGMDFEWLGIGRIRFVMNIQGINVAVHEESFNNGNPAVDSSYRGAYMKQPNMFVRFEARAVGPIVNTLTGEGVVQTCSTVQSETGLSILGKDIYAPGCDFADPGFAITNVTSLDTGDWGILMGVRIRADKIGTISWPVGASVRSDNTNFHWMLLLNPTINTASNTPDAFVNLPNSNLQIQVGFNDTNLVTAMGNMLLGGVGSSQTRQSSGVIDSSLKLGFDLDKVSDVVYLALQPGLGETNKAFEGGMQLKELY